MQANRFTDALAYYTYQEDLHTHALAAGGFLNLAGSRVRSISPSGAAHPFRQLPRLRGDSGETGAAQGSAHFRYQMRLAEYEQRWRHGYDRDVWMQQRLLISAFNAAGVRDAREVRQLLDIFRRTEFHIEVDVDVESGQLRLQGAFTRTFSPPAPSIAALTVPQPAPRVLGTVPPPGSAVQPPTKRARVDAAKSSSSRPPAAPARSTVASVPAASVPHPSHAEAVDVDAFMDDATALTAAASASSAHHDAGSAASTHRASSFGLVDLLAAAASDANKAPFMASDAASAAAGASGAAVAVPAGEASIVFMHNGVAYLPLVPAVLERVFPGHLLPERIVPQVKFHLHGRRVGESVVDKLPDEMTAAARQHYKQLTGSKIANNAVYYELQAVRNAFEHWAEVHRVQGSKK